MLGKPIPIELGGKMRNLVYDFNALADMEEVLGIDIQNIGKVLSGKASLKDMRGILWAGLVQEEPGLTVKEVGRMITELADLKKLAEAVRAAFEAAFPPVEKKPDPKLAIPKNRPSRETAR